MCRPPLEELRTIFGLVATMAQFDPVVLIVEDTVVPVGIALPSGLFPLTFAFALVSCIQTVNPLVVRGLTLSIEADDVASAMIVC